MTLVGRLVAMGLLSLVAVAATAPGVAAGGLLDLHPGTEPGSESGSEPTAECPGPPMLALSCPADLPPAPVTGLVLDPGGTGLVPSLVAEVDGLLGITDQLPVVELMTLTPLTARLPVTELVQPVTEILAPSNPDAPAAVDAAAVDAAADPGSSPAAGPIAARPDAAHPPAEVDSDAHHARTTEHPVAAAVNGPNTARSPQGVLKASTASASGLGERLGGTGGVPAMPIGAALAALLVGGGVSVAVELARGGGGGLAGVVAFNVWLRRQLRETRMSQRQLAAFSGVDHSTISRLLSGEHTPSLATATKLVEALRKLGGLPHAAEYFARLSESRVLPTKRVEEALLGDDELDDQDVRLLMHAYLVARARRRRERNAAAGNGSPMASEGPTPA